MSSQVQSSQCCFGFSSHQDSELGMLQYKGKDDLVNQDRLNPRDEKGKKEVDALLAEALSDLTFEELQEQQEVLHGVEKQIADESVFIDESLQELDGQLKRIKSGSMYEVAERLGPGHVGARPFRIMFLRANRYDAKDTADQMLRFFQAKRELFGMAKLVKDITIKDLDEDDVACLKTGFMQTAGKDSSNREVVFVPSSLRSFKTIQNEMRARYFFIMNMVQSEETQLRGVVLIPYAVGEFREIRERGGFFQTVQLALSLPFYLAAVHFCCDNPSEYILYSLGIKSMSAKLRARFQRHRGSHIEVQYKLSGFGIPTGMLPLEPETNHIILDRHLAWCQCIMEDRQESTNPSEPIIELNANDFLYVDGKTCNHLGNNRLRSLVKELKGKYQSGTRTEKRLVVDNVIAEMHASGGRFLRQLGTAPPVWTEVPLPEIQGKIKQMFRNSKRSHGPVSGNTEIGALITGEPLPDDVVLGAKGNKNRGNLLLRQLIKDRTDEYNSLDRGTKMRLVEAILHRVRSEGGRFLIPTPSKDGWIEVSNDVARGRISKSFRNIRRYGTK